MNSGGTDGEYIGVFYHLRHGRFINMSQGARNQGFWDLLSLLEIQGARIFLVRDASQK